jgi:hypothetical protein
VRQNKNEVKIRLVGELGNQLFQLVTGLLVAKRLDSKLEVEEEETKILQSWCLDCDSLSVAQ